MSAQGRPFHIVLIPLALAALLAPRIAPAQTPLNFPVYAGSPPSAGYEDGPAAAARFGFDFTGFVVVDAAGNAFITDPANRVIRRISAGGVVTTFAGLEGSPGNVDGTGGNARFGAPGGIALDSSGNFYVADTGASTIRKITAAGVVTTLAGSPGQTGSADGTGAAARFNQPMGVEVDSAGNLFVADFGNNTIRKVTPAGVVTTLAGQVGVCGAVNGTGAGASFCFPSGVAIDPATSDLFVADYGNSIVRKVTSAGAVTTVAGQAGVIGNSDGFGAAASFNVPWSIARDPSGLLYVTDESNRNVRMINPSTTAVSTLAGPNAALCSPVCPFGSANGTGTAARFGAPEDVAYNPVTGGLVVTDIFNHDVRAITLPGAVVTRIAGVPGAVGYADGTGTAAQFNFRAGALTRDANFVYLADTSSHTIRKIAAGGVVTTFAGSAMNSGYTEGTGSAALFNSPAGVVADGFGNVFVADTFNHKIRFVNSGGVVSTWAGPDAATCTASANLCPGGLADGNGFAARFRQPRALAIDGSGTLFVADRNGNNIRRIDSARNVTTFAGSPTGVAGSADGTGTAASFSSPQGIAVDAAGNVYVADTGNRTIRRITPAGVVTTIAGSPGLSGSADGTGNLARFSRPTNLSLDAAGNLLIADPGNSTLRKMTPAGVVTTIAGLADRVGGGEGTGAFARFFQPSSVITDASGNYLVMDAGNEAIRVSAATGLNDLATIDKAVASVGAARQLDTNPVSAVSWSWKLIRQPTGSVSALSSPTIRNPAFTPDVADYYTFRVTAANGANSATTEVSLRTAFSPRIVASEATRPLAGQQNQTIVVSVEDGPAPASLLFSDGANPTVAPASSAYDEGRGLFLITVPAAAATGNLKLTAGGTDAPPYYFRRIPGALNLGSSTVTGVVTRQSDGAPIVGAGVILLISNSCRGGSDLWSFTVTDAAGAYTLPGVVGTAYQIMTFPPFSYGLAGGGASATLPATGVNIALTPGVTVSGRVIDAASRAPRSKVRVNFEGPGFELVTTDAAGNFSVHLAPGSWRYTLTPSPGSANANLEGQIVVTAPGPQSLGDLVLPVGVRISGLMTRQADGTPIAGAEVEAASTSGPYTRYDRAPSLGDGSYSVIVPPNGTYQLWTQVDSNSGFIQQNATVAVATSPVTQNLALQDAAYVKGTVRDRATTAPVGGLQMTAVRVSDGMYLGSTSTCPDGTYSLPIPAGVANSQYIQTSNCTGCTNPSPPPQPYALQTWNGTATGTFFRCEGTPVSIAATGGQLTGVDFNVPVAATVQGSFFTQASNCTAKDTTLGNFSLTIDDGAAHACALGANWGGNPAPGDYQQLYLPPTSALASGNLRVCWGGNPTYAPQCFNLRRTDQPYTPVTVASGAIATANFCVGNRPTAQVNGLRAAKSGANVQLSWGASADLYQTQYTVWAATTAIPVPAPGSFPTNPAFSNIFQGPTVPVNLNPGPGSFFFLVTATGPNGNYGPSGSYGY